MTQTLTERCDEIDLAKKRVDSCFEDYRQAVLAYAAWMDGWRKRQQKQPEA